MRAVLFCFGIAAGLGLIGGCSANNAGEMLLANGTATVAAGQGLALITVQVAEAGTLQGRLTWSGLPAQMQAAFRHEAEAGFRGLTEGASPAVTTTPVTPADVSGGLEWTFVVGNTSGSSVQVQYEVRFFPD